MKSATENVVALTYVLSRTSAIIKQVEDYPTSKVWTAIPLTLCSVTASSIYEDDILSSRRHVNDYAIVKSTDI